MADLLMEQEAEFGSFDVNSVAPLVHKPNRSSFLPKAVEPSLSMSSSSASESSLVLRERYMVLKPASSITEPAAAVRRIHPWGPEAQGLHDVETQAGETATMHTESTPGSQQSQKHAKKTSFFYKSASQKNLQQRMNMNQSSSENNKWGLRLNQEELQEDFYTSNIRQGIEIARQHSKHASWKTPYEVDAPRAIMLPRDHSHEMSNSSSEGDSAGEMGRFLKSIYDDPATVEARIWTGIERLMADTFSSDDDSITMEQVLPKALVRAMSTRSMISTGSDRASLSSQTAREQLDELDMAQAALNSFMDMILPARDADGFPDESSMPTLASCSVPKYDNDDDDESYDDIALAEVALNNFMHVLLQEVEFSSHKKKSAVQLLDLFQWTVKVNVDAQERVRFLQEERSKSQQIEKELTFKIKQQQEEIRMLKQQEEEELKRLEQEEERLKKQLQQEEEQQRLDAQRRLEQEEAMIMRELEEQEEALQKKMEELKAASRFKVGALATVGAMTIKQTPADRRRARRMEFTNDESNDMEDLRAKIAEAELMLKEETQDGRLLDESFMSTKKKRKKKSIPVESPTRASAPAATTTSASAPSTPSATAAAVPSKQSLASEGTIRRLPRQFSSATIPSLTDSLEHEEGDTNNNTWAVPITMRSELLEEDGSIDPTTLPNLAKQKQSSASSASNKQSKSSGDIPRYRKTQDSGSEASAKSVPSYLPSTSNRHLFASNTKQQQAQQFEASLDLTSLPNLAVERVARKQQDAPVADLKPFWAAIGGRPIVMSTADSHNGSGDVGTVKSNLLPSSFHESEHINGMSSDSGTSSTPSLIKRISSTQATSSQAGNEAAEELPDLKSISEGSMSEASSSSSSDSSDSTTEDSSTTNSSTTNSSTTSSLPSAVPSNSPSAVPSNSPSATASATPSYIVEERVEHAEGSRGPTPDYALTFSDSFVKTTSPQNLLPTRTESLESEADSYREFPRFFRARSRINLGVLSEAGDVFTDDVSQYSLDRFHTMGFDATPDVSPHGTPKGSGRDVASGSTDRRAELVRQLSQHTTVCSVDGAGDIHVGATVRFGGEMDSSDDVSSSDDSDDITLDSELQADELRYDGFRRYVPEMKKDTRRMSLGGCIRSSINAIKEKSRCVGYWTCRDTRKAMKRRPKLEKRLSSRKCLLHTEEETYDRSHVLSGTKQDQRRQTQSLSGIDEDGFVVSYDSNQ